MNRFLKFAVAVAVVGSFVRFQADAAVYRFHLPSKYIEGGTLALGEAADIILLGIGDAQPANLRTMLCDNEGAPLAISGTNGFAACEGGARGRMSLATRELAAVFEDEAPLREIPLVFAVWDAAESTLLGSAPVTVRNNPFADASGSVTSIWGRVNYGSNAVADEAHAIAVQALNAANAAQGAVDALAGATTDATNGLWGAIANLDNATNDLDGRVLLLETGLGTAETNTANGISDLRNELLARMDAGIEPAFTNGTARGLAVTPLDHEEFLAGSLYETPGVWLTTETNQYGVTVARRLFLNALDAWLWLGPGGLEASGDISATGYTLGSTTVRDWGLFATAGALGAASNYFRGLIVTNQNSLQNRVNSLDNALNDGNSGVFTRLDGLEGRMEDAESEIGGLNQSATWAYNRAVEASNGIVALRAATNALHGLSRTNRDSITTISNTLYRGNSSVTNRLYLLETATGELDTLANANADAIADLRDSVTTGTNGTLITTSHAWRLAHSTNELSPNSSFTGLALAGKDVILDAGTNTFSIRMDDESGVNDWNGLFAGRNSRTGKSFLEIVFDEIIFSGNVDFQGWTITGDDFEITDALTLTGESITSWSDLTDPLWTGIRAASNALANAIAGAASQNWVNGAINDFSDAIAEDFATYTYVDNLIEGISNALDNISATDGTNAVSLTGITSDIAALKNATNNIRGNYVKKAGDTMTGGLTIRGGGLVQGTGSYGAGHLTSSGTYYGIAFGNYARSTNTLAFVWSGVTGTNYYGSHGAGTFSINPIDGLSGFWIGETNLADHLAALLSGQSGGGGGGTEVVTTNFLEKTGGKMTGQLEVAAPVLIGTRASNTSTGTYSVAQGYRAEASASYAVAGGYQSAATAEGARAYGKNAKATDAWSWVWSGTAGEYGSHGEGSWSADPVGGITNFWIGTRNLRQHFSNETVTALSGMHGGVELIPGANITITTNPVDGTLTIASTASGGGGGTVTNTVTLGTLTAGNGYIQVDPQGAEGWSISSDPGVASLNGAAGALRLLRWDGNQLGVTDGAIRLPAPDRSAIETLGEEVFKAQVVVTTNSPAITGFEVDADNDEATITFYASVETNRLEWYDPAEEEPEWAAWDNCSWSYTGTQGTCTLVGPQEGAFYRILVPEGYTTPDRTNVYLVASVPIYFGEAGVEENRFATMADVAAAVARGSGTTRIAAVTRRGYSDPMNVSPTNVAWNFSGDGVYFQDLSVGGWTNEISTVTTNGGTVTTNTTTVTDTGSITLNGQRIHSWGELAIYADGAEITVETGVSGVNGIEGAVTLEAGDNVTLSKNDATGTITISATGGGGGGGGGGGSGPWNPNTRVISATNETVLASDYLIWMDSETAQDEQTIHLPDMATDSQSIVIRHLGSDHPTTIVRATATATNTYQLTGDGASIAVDWLGAKTNWYWRQAY